MSLKVLNLGYNRLEALPAAALADIEATLEELYLNGNGTGSVGAGAFDGMTGLRQLTLHENALTLRPAGLFDRLTLPKALQL